MSKNLMDKQKKIEIAKKLVKDGLSEVTESADSVILVAFSAAEEERLHNEVVEKCLPFVVKLIGKPTTQGASV